MNAQVSQLAHRLWPDFDSLPESDRDLLAGSMVTVAYSLPLDVLALGVLVASTDWQAMAANWPMLLMLFLIGAVLSRLSFYQVVGEKAGEYSFNSSSLASVSTIAGLFLFGVPGIWITVALTFVFYATIGVSSLTRPQRWSWLHNLTFNVWATILTLLTTLAVYGVLGGQIPLPGLNPRVLWPAFVAVAVNLALSMLFLWFLIASQARIRGDHRPTYPRKTLYFFLLSEAPAFFGILAAGLYAESGLLPFLFLMAGVVLSSLLARRMSQAAVVSQQRSREISQLEQLGREIIAGPADASSLPALLAEFVPRMFQYRQAEIRLFTGEVLLRLPQDQSPLPEGLWQWFSRHPEARVLPIGPPLPWSGKPMAYTVVLAPILAMETSTPLGGICLVQDKIYAFDVELDPQGALRVLADQVASALHSADTYQQALAHEVAVQELAVAGQIQASFLPDTLPEIEGWQIAAALLPARETSGDFYDAFTLPNGRLGLLVADVSDKGMGAALYMALSRTLLRTYAFEYHARPDFVMRVANRRILADTQAGLFVSVFYGVVDPYAGTLTYANAGHNPAYLVSHGSRAQVASLTRTGMVLGVMEGREWEEVTLPMHPGDMLVLYSDGITEAQNEQGEFFGEERLRALVGACYGQSAPAVRDGILAAVHDFAGDAVQFDDITLMVVVRND
jgi:serine phosphatase RsbU (regulator of sigma subunit)